MAASHVINGFGKTTGLVQIEELGTLETPILFTNTLSVGTVETALVKYMLDRNPTSARPPAASTRWSVSATTAA